MSTIAQIGVDITGNSAKFVSEIGKAQAALNSTAAKMNSNLTSIRSGFDNLRSAAASFGIGLGVGAIVAWGRASLEAAAQVSTLSQQIGTTTDMLQVYQFAASQTGVAQDAMKAGLMRLTASIGEAEQGSKAQIDALNAMDVNILDANGKFIGFDATVREIADAYQNAGDKAQFAAEAKKLMGREAQNLIPIFAGGAAGLDRLSAAEQDNGHLSQQLIDQAKKANESLDLLWHTFEKAGEAAWAKMAPGITAAADAMRNLIVSSDGAIDRMLKFYDATVGKNPIDRWWSNILGIAPPGGSGGATGSWGTTPAGASSSGASGAGPGGVSGAPGIGTHNPLSTEDIARAQAIQKVIDGLKLQADYQTRLAATDAANTRAIEDLNDAYEIAQALQSARVPLASKEGEQIAALIVQRNEEKRAVDAAKKGYDDFTAAMKEEHDARIQEHQTVLDSIAEIDRQTEQNRLEAETIGLTAGQIAALNMQRQLENKLLKDHHQLSDADASAANVSLKQLQESTDELNRQKAAAAALGDFMTQSFDRIGQSITEAMVQQGGSAMVTFRSIALGVLSEIEQKFIELSIMNPIKQMLGLPGSDQLPTMSSVFGWLGSMFGGGASGGLTASSMLDVQLGAFPFHSGGIAGQGSPSRFVPAAAFAGAPRFHSGGFAGNEVPAVLRKGEGIFTPEQMAAMGGGQPIVVNLNVSTGVQQTVRAEMMAMLPEIKKQTTAAVYDARRRNTVRALG